MGPPRAARKAAIGSIADEALGIPSAMIAAPGFVKQAKATAAAAGLAELRVAEYPGAFASHTREELLENTRKVLWPQVKAARIPLGQRAFASYWGNPGSAFDPARYPLRAHERRIASQEGAAETAAPPWLAWTGLERLETVPAMAPGKSAFLVTGDPSRNKVLTVPGGGFATVRIELPAAWDALMAERGYAPLSSFRVASAASSAPSRKPANRPFASMRK